jgi:hypothetical protein
MKAFFRAIFSRFFSVGLGWFFLPLLCSTNLHAAGPRISCAEPEYNFGDAPNTCSVTNVFLIHNTGDQPLQIGEVRGCCGASGIVAEKLLAPGSGTTCRVSFNLIGRKGIQRKCFYIGSNDQTQPYYQVMLVGTVTSEVVVEPDIVDFGQIGMTDKVEREVRITCSTSLVMSVTNVVLQSGAFAAKCEKAGKGIVVKIRTMPPLKPGVTQVNMQIFTDNPKHKEFDIHVMATVSSDIVVVPREILLVESEGDVTPVTRYLAIRSRTGKSFRILSVESPDPDIQSQVSELSQNGYRCEFKNILPFSELDGKMFVVKTDHDDGREIAIPVHVIKRLESGK